MNRLCTLLVLLFLPSAAFAGEVKTGFTLSGAAGTVSVEFGEHSRKGYFLDLLRVEYLRDGKPVGVHQRFEEAGGRGAFSMEVPTPAEEFDLVRVMFKSANLDRQKLEEDYEAGWYRCSWSHFTTAVPTKNGMKRFVLNDKIPDDLFGWLKASDIEFLIWATSEAVHPVNSKGRR